MLLTRDNKTESFVLVVAGPAGEKKDFRLVSSLSCHVMIIWQQVKTKHNDINKRRLYSVYSV